MILSCTCTHAYQDLLYGPGKRVHNQRKAANQFTCTVCGKQQIVGSAVVEKKEEVKK